LGSVPDAPTDLADVLGANHGFISESSSFRVPLINRSDAERTEFLLCSPDGRSTDGTPFLQDVLEQLGPAIGKLGAGVVRMEYLRQGVIVVRR
jgi:hypothetical protein